MKIRMKTKFKKIFFAEAINILKSNNQRVFHSNFTITFEFSMWKGFQASRALKNLFKNIVAL